MLLALIVFVIFIQNGLKTCRLARRLGGVLLFSQRDRKNVNKTRKAKSTSIVVRTEILY